MVVNKSVLSENLELKNALLKKSSAAIKLLGKNFKSRETE
jgi:hypothetical protein